MIFSDCNKQKKYKESKFSKESKKHLFGVMAEYKFMHLNEFGTCASKVNQVNFDFLVNLNYS